MTTFARARITDESLPIVDCVYNTDLSVPVKDDQLFFVMSEEVHEKFGVDYDLGEMLIYSPRFEEDLHCMWIAQTIDFDFIEMEELTNGYHMA